MMGPNVGKSILRDLAHTDTTLTRAPLDAEKLLALSETALTLKVAEHFIDLDLAIAPKMAKIRALGMMETGQCRNLVSVEESDRMGELVKETTGFLRDTAAWFKPLKQLVDRVKKIVLDAEKAKTGPVTEADIMARARINSWLREQEDNRREEQDRIAAEMRKREEDQRLEVAARLEAEGKQQLAEQVLTQEPTPVEVILPKTQAPAGVSSSQRWTFDVINPDEIPREWLLPEPDKLDDPVAYPRIKKAVAAMKSCPAGLERAIRVRAETDIRVRA